MSFTTPAGKTGANLMRSELLQLLELLNSFSFAIRVSFAET
jgi:hypothetical protein